MSKLVNNFIDKRFLTSDANTIVTELEIQHPAAKMLVLAAQMQATEFGDGTNFTIQLAAELLSRAGTLLNQGVHLSSILEGYDLALRRCTQILPTMVVFKVTKFIKDRNEMLKIIIPVICTKIKNPTDCLALAENIADACLHVMPTASSGSEFNTDNVRVNKLIGGNLKQSYVVKGMVLAREPKTAVRSLTDCKVCVLANALEHSTTEGTGNVLINTTEQLLSFSKSEEDEMEQIIKSYSDAGVKALIVGGHIAPLALHYLDKYNILAVATPSKFDIKRFCRSLKVPALQRLVSVLIKVCRI